MKMLGQKILILMNHTMKELLYRKMFVNSIVFSNLLDTNLVMQLRVEFILLHILNEILMQIKKSLKLLQTTPSTVSICLNTKLSRQYSRIKTSLSKENLILRKKYLMMMMYKLLQSQCQSIKCLVLVEELKRYVHKTSMIQICSCPKTTKLLRSETSPRQICITTMTIYNLKMIKMILK